jgi:hypothetical protein
MTQALNLALLANKVNTSGQLDGPTGVTGAVPSATTTANITGGTQGQVPVQSAAGTTTFMDSSFAFKNRIINGAMVIDQRNAGASVTNVAGSVYSLDRWKTYGSQASKFTIQQNAGSVTPPSGYINYLGVTSLSAYTVGSGEEFEIYQNIEGFNCADLGFGTANAKTVTLSFWVRSSLTGTFGGSLQNYGSTRSYVFSYTISSANTWEQKSITIAGDQSGTWLTNNSFGIGLLFGIGQGSTLTNTAGSWYAGNYNNVTGGTSVVGTSGATFYITGVQLEKGSTATSFDYRPYGTELALCQRYYQNLTLGSGNQPYGPTGYCRDAQDALYFVPLPVQMRSAPTFTVALSSAQVLIGNGNTKTPTSISYLGAVVNGISFEAYFNTSQLTAGYSVGWYGGSFTVQVASEL